MIRHSVTNLLLALVYFTKGTVCTRFNTCVSFTHYRLLPLYNNPGERHFKNIDEKADNLGRKIFSSMLFFILSETNIPLDLIVKSSRHDIHSHSKNDITLLSILSNQYLISKMCSFAWDFTLYQQYFTYLTATVHKSVFPGLILAST